MAQKIELKGKSFLTFKAPQIFLSLSAISFVLFTSPIKITSTNPSFLAFSTANNTPLSWQQDTTTFFFLFS